jgi:glycosyltransferase involved in cell wall biosynthesis
MLRLSVVIPFYNVEKYIAQCLRSVLENDMPEKEFEIVLIDDESPDGSLKIAKEFANKHQNIRIISQKNTGISGARNAGIKSAQAPYILFIDSDDWIADNTLSKIVKEAEQKQLDILEFGIEKVDNHGLVLGKTSNTSNGEVLQGLVYYSKVRYVNSVFNKLYRKAFLLENQLFFIEKIYVEDFELNTRAFMAATRVSAVETLIYQYRQSPNSITRNLDNARKNKMLEDHVTVLKLTTNLYFQSDKKSEIQFFVGERIGFLLVSIFFFMLKNGYSYKEMKDMKSRLKQENLFMLDFQIHEKNKDLFRKMLKRHFSFLAVVKPFAKSLIPS